MNNQTIYFAAGCFWGNEYMFSSLPGVIDTCCGYANGKTLENVSYELVCSGVTNLKETVKVEYDPEIISLKALIFAFYSCIDVDTPNRQGMDFGTQYQAGIFWTDEDDKKTVMQCSAVEASYNSHFAVLLEPIDNFYTAEEYHQKYLNKNPGGYCHISPVRVETLAEMDLNGIKYDRPAKDIIRRREEFKKEVAMIESGGLKAHSYE